MHLGASEGQLKVVHWLIERGVRANPRDRWGSTPLEDAEREGFPGIVSFLSENESNNGSEQDDADHKTKTGWSKIRKLKTATNLRRAISVNIKNSNFENEEKQVEVVVMK